jgi:hypothetical protein
MTQSVVAQSLEPGAHVEVLDNILPVKLKLYRSVTGDRYLFQGLLSCMFLPNLHIVIVKKKLH